MALVVQHPVTAKVVTPDQFEAFLALPANQERRFELIDGEIYEVPSTMYSSLLSALLIWHLSNHVMPRNLGLITPPAGPGD